MHAIVHAADIQDRDGGAFVMATMFGMYPFLMKLYADGGYQGPLFRRAVAKIMARLNVEIVKRSDHTKGFVVLPKRWVVERTFAWLGRCRRLAKDWENLSRKALAFLRLASIRLMLETMQSRMISPDRRLGCAAPTTQEACSLGVAGGPANSTNCSRRWLYIRLMNSTHLSAS